MFKDALKSLRLQNKMTQEELSRKLNTNGFTVNFLDVYFDRCGNVSNVLVELEKEVM